jgi:hypothetical protein
LGKKSHHCPSIAQLDVRTGFFCYNVEHNLLIVSSLHYHLEWGSNFISQSLHNLPTFGEPWVILNSKAGDWRISRTALLLSEHTLLYPKIVSTNVVFLKPWGFGIRGIHDRERSHDSQSLTVLGKPP